MEIEDWTKQSSSHAVQHVQSAWSVSTPALTTQPVTLTDTFLQSLTTLLRRTCAPLPDASTDPSGLQSRDAEYVEQQVKAYEQRIANILAYLNDYSSSIYDLQLDIRNLESIHACWKLMAALRQSEVYAQHVQAEGREGVPPTDIAHRYSSQSLISHYIQTTPSLHRLQAILNWCEELAIPAINIEMMLSGAQNSFYFYLKSTLRKLQRSSQDDIFLDPDFLTRSSQAAQTGIIDKQDGEEEDRLLNYVWQLLRAGQVHRAADLCRAYHQDWRAASLLGGELLHDAFGAQYAQKMFGEKKSSNVPIPAAPLIVGNPTRFLWKHTCAQLCASSPQSCEKAIYSLLSGELYQALAYCQNWMEACWVYMKCMMEEQIDLILHKEHVYAIDRKFYHPPKINSINQIFDNLSSNSNQWVHVNIHNASQSPYHRLQRLLILYNSLEAQDHKLLTSIEDELAHTIKRHFPDLVHSMQQSTFSLSAQLNDNSHTQQQQQQEWQITPSYITFAVHLYLYLHPSVPTTPLTPSGVFLVLAYIEYLSMVRQYELIASYAALLPQHERVVCYVRFLRSLENHDDRKQYLLLSKSFFPQDQLSITKALVSNILACEQSQAAELVGAGTSAAAAATPLALPTSTPSVAVATEASSWSAEHRISDHPILQSDLDKIASLDCFEFREEYSHASQEALAQVCSLFRYFILSDKVAAANKLSDHLSAGRLDAHITNVEKPNNDEGRWESLHREYFAYKVYIKSLNWYNAWCAHMANKPVLKKHLESHYQQQLQQWKDERKSIVDSCVAAMLEVLQYEHGWLLHSHLSDSRRSGELHTIRHKGIPHIIFLFYKVCDESEAPQLCLQLLELVTAPLYHLSDCISSGDAQLMIKKFRKSYIQHKLAPKPAQAE